MLMVLATLLIITALLYIIYRHRNTTWHKRHRHSDSTNFTFKI